eukprot:1014524_1
MSKPNSASDGDPKIKTCRSCLANIHITARYCDQCALPVLDLPESGDKTPEDESPIELSVRLWDKFAEVSQKLRQSKRTARETLNYFEQRARLEEKYAKELSVLAQTCQLVEEATLNASWDAIRKADVNTANIQTKFATKILSRTHTELDQIYQNEKKTGVDLLERYAASQKMFEKANTAKRKAIEKSESLKVKLRQCEVKIASPKLTEKQKKKELKNQKSLEKECERAHQVLLDAQTNVFSRTNQFHTTTAIILQEFEKSELDRVSAMKKILEDYLKFALDTGDSRSTSLSDTFRVVARTHSLTDLRAYVERTQSGAKCPWDGTNSRISRVSWRATEDEVIPASPKSAETKTAVAEPNVGSAIVKAAKADGKAVSAERKSDGAVAIPKQPERKVSAKPNWNVVRVRRKVGRGSPRNSNDAEVKPTGAEVKPVEAKAAEVVKLAVVEVKPVEIEVKAAAVEVKSADDQVKPDETEVKPAEVEEVKLAVVEVKPVEIEVKAAAVEVKSADDQVKPDETEVKPAEVEEVKPAEAEEKSTESELNAIEESNASKTEEVKAAKAEVKAAIDAVKAAEAERMSVEIKTKAIEEEVKPVAAEVKSATPEVKPASSGAVDEKKTAADTASNGSDSVSASPLKPQTSEDVPEKPKSLNPFAKSEEKGDTSPISEAIASPHSEAIASPPSATVRSSNPFANLESKTVTNDTKILPFSSISDEDAQFLPPHFKENQKGGNPFAPSVRCGELKDSSFLAKASTGSVIGGIVAKKTDTSIEFLNFMPGMSADLTELLVEQILVCATSNSIDKFVYAGPTLSKEAASGLQKA